ncbi:MAG: ATP-binding protein [Betaproteobacteria bacterium]|jgi:hypothetical protein|nr:ATP-binding protein [Betaproteobacteria bacterium]MBK7275128.1 ATP-binding protein [Betaproteobacteria bacterium]MBK7459128.1 ATP-binding protein [Betaproteobacteria bacterium]MBK7514306.1 ATP-binding protein [Betaproteobacteria bacterium]MBK8104734.1 ATP-binding protein [Betaproteobacteria bacterium]
MSTGARRKPAAARVPAPVAALPSAVGSAVLERELDWFEGVLQARLTQYFREAGADRAGAVAPPPPLPAGNGPSHGADRGYASLVNELALGTEERLVLMLALVPHLRPQALDLLFVRNKNLDRGFTEFGGCKGRTHGGFLPTAETAAFVLAGDDLARRLAVFRLFDEDAVLRRSGLIRIETEATGEPALAAALVCSPELVARATTGERHKPDFGPGFPARRITTGLGWSDLVLAPEVQDEVQTILTWIEHGAALLRDWGLQQAVKPGWRSLFHGPPGTGKTLTATLLGQAVGADVYRIDLSMVVSKYIGETEKNLAGVFDQAQHRHWILFFDEADALFGKRTSTSSSNDRYANQEVSYLLQRVEDFPGTVILASNLKGNIDEAFARRFQSIVYFPMPDAEQRLQLWRGLLSRPERVHVDVDLPALAEAHELSGGAIANVVRHGAVTALRAGRTRITALDLRQGVARELRKEGRTV